MRSALERVPVLRWGIANAVELKNTLLDNRRSEQAELEEFYRQEDPYGFERPEEKIRFERAMQMLEHVRDGGRFERAFEVGCSEGKFTAILAPCCARVTAVDISQRAVERAQSRCSGLDNIEFGVWNMRHDPVPGKFDLIVAVGVVEYVRRPATIQLIREKLVSALEPGGHLLVGTTVAERENTWLGRRLLRGTTIDRFFEAHPQMEPVASSLDACAMNFEHVLLRKV